MDYSKILSALLTYIEQSFSAAEKQLPYHNIEHTKAVLDAAHILCEHYQLNNEDRFIIQSAALFHDVGITHGEIKNHELRSAQMAETWLNEQQIPAETIEKIKNCILATRVTSKPQNLNEQIICDADLWNLGTDTFTDNQKKVRQEIALMEGREIEKGAWRSQIIEMLQSHQYFTDYAKNTLETKKEENLNQLLEKQEKKLNKEAEAPLFKNKKGKEIDPNIPTRGIETMFKVTIHNHLELSSMADAKANIMISVNSIIVSVVLSVLVRRLEEFPAMIIPTCILLCVNVVTIVFAILTVRPKILKGPPPGKQPVVSNKRVNLLFFGEFNKMSLKEYTVKMKEMMREKDYLYENMINNIYFMGIVLVKKYQYLRLAYNVFMYGFIIAVLAFSIAVFI
jgi:predicted metal-dependent HD superfamily phosphohydrolase